MCPRGRPRGQGRPRGLHLCKKRCFYSQFEQSSKHSNTCTCLEQLHFMAANDLDHWSNLVLYHFRLINK